MDQNQYGQFPIREVDSLAPTHNENQYQSAHMMAPTYSPTQAIGYPPHSSYLQEQPFSHYYSLPKPQEELQQHLNDFWATQKRKIEETTDFRKNNLPLARIKKIMKAEEEVKNVAAETCVVFAKACEMFIMELTMRSWVSTEENRRKTLQKSDIETTIKRTDEYDFLEPVVLKDENDMADHVHEALPHTPRGVTGVPVTNLSYPYMPSHQHVAGPSSYTLKTIMGMHIPNQANYVQQTHPLVHQLQPPPQQNNSPHPNE